MYCLLILLFLIEISNAQCVHRVHERFAGTDAERLNELNGLATVDPKNLVMAMRGICPGRVTSASDKRENTICVVVVPTSIPTERREC